MGRKGRESKGREMTPNYFVFCEGETEVVYVEMLRSYYRLPIRIIAKKTLLNITPALVERCRSAYIQTINDRTYLMYDLDVEEMLARLRKVDGATLLCTNPCFEFWLLLHYADPKAPLGSEECVKRLSSFEKRYKKGELAENMRQCLMANVEVATERAKCLKEYSNPSTTVWLFLQDLERERKSIGKR